MNKLLGLSLGILAAIGGFVDIGDLVFNTAAGATFGYQLMWVIPVGVVGIIVYTEMCGRVAAVSGKAVFDAVRERVGFKAALGALVSSEVVNLMTLAAELGGVAIALQLLSGLPYRWLILLSAIGFAVVIWVTSFNWIERIFGYGGLCMLVFAVAAVKLGPDWAKVGNGFIPHISQNNPLLYAYFVVGLLGAAMTPYEVYFYSSGGIEEEWSPKDIGLNRANAIVGYGLGGTLSLALMVVGATVFLGHGISPEHLGTIALGAGDPLGKVGLLLGIIGIFFAVGGASIDTVFSGAYNLAQFCGWEWGRYRHPKGAPRFTITWLVLLVLAMGIVMTGVDAVVLTEYAVIFSVVALPLTYIPILLVANDKAYMGRYGNGRFANVVGFIYLMIIMAVALTAIPLMILTNAGQN
ncbi:MAG: Nramp family divalent metal transporter [Actinobacteria bacterium]|nr:Nramp family divalent metal transporter [Actinomycetota bacterium]